MAKQSGIFFVSNGEGLVRITQTRDFGKRFSEWQAATPSPLQVLAKVTTTESRCNLAWWLWTQIGSPSVADALIKQSNPCEATLFDLLHGFLGCLRVRGEWFSVDEAMIKNMPIEIPNPKWEDLISANEMVWQSVAAAESQVPSPESFDPTQYSGKTRASLMLEHMIGWLVDQGKQNIVAVLLYQKQWDTLQDYLNDAGMRYIKGIFSDDAFAALVTWGPSVFECFMSNTPLKPFVLDDVDVVSIAESAIARLIPLGKEPPRSYIDMIYARIMSGMHPTEFAGWDGDRFVAEFDGTTP